MKNLSPTAGALLAPFQRVAQGVLAPRLACAGAVLLAVLALGYGGCWRGQCEQQQNGRVQEAGLRQQYQLQVARAGQFPAVQAQKIRLEQYWAGLHQQLPGRADIAALWSDVHQAGVERGLQFDSFKPGPEVRTAFYVELPVDIKVSGSYHAIGAFAADLARLPHLVTLENLTLTVGKDRTLLNLAAVARTVRSLDPEEQRQAPLKEAKK